MGKMQQGRRLQGLGELQARMGSNGACARPMGCRGGKKLSQWAVSTWLLEVQQGVLPFGGQVEVKAGVSGSGEVSQKREEVRG